MSVALTEGCCEQCGARFNCTADLNCWCMALPHVLPFAEAGCLCPDCLQKAVTLLADKQD